MISASSLSAFQFQRPFAQPNDGDFAGGSYFNVEITAARRRDNLALKQLGAASCAMGAGEMIEVATHLPVLGKPALVIAKQDFAATLGLGPRWKEHRNTLNGIPLRIADMPAWHAQAVSPLSDFVARRVLHDVRHHSSRQKAPGPIARAGLVAGRSAHGWAFTPWRNGAKLGTTGDPAGLRVVAESMSATGGGAKRKVMRPLAEACMGECG